MNSAGFLDVADRVRRVRAALVASACDAVIVTSLVNVRWLTGFTGSNATLVVSQDQLVLLTDGRYRVQSARQLAKSKSSAELRVVASGPDPEIRLMLAGVERVGLEAANISWLRQSQIAATLPEAKLVPLTSLVEDLRRIKDPYELECIERAATIADGAFAETYPLLVKPAGLTEAAFARALEAAMDRLGSDEPSFETIVASGPNSALPHANPGSRVIEVGDLVVIDFGAKIDGYGSDMTRTVLAGAGKPTSAQAKLYEAVERAQQAGVDAVKAGVSELTIDSVCRSILNEAGYGEHFVHGTGHSLGLEIHEQPILSSRATGTLKAGLVVTVEPGAYLPELGGVRVEDCVLVTETGCRLLTHSPKGLIPQF